MPVDDVGHVTHSLLSQAKSRADAETYMQNAKRTFAIFVGVGDFSSQRMDIVGYKEVGGGVI